MRALITGICCAPMLLQAQAQWTKFAPASATTTFHALAFASPRAGFAVGTNGFIARTRDGGAAWSITRPWRVSLFCVHFPSASTGYAAGDFGIVLKTMNGGDSWSPILGRTGTTFRSTYFLDEQRGFVAGDSTILATLDGGRTWVDRSPKDREGFLSIRFQDAESGVVGSQGSIHRTTDGGRTWTRSAIAGDVRMIRFASDGYGYALADGDVFESLHGPWIKRSEGAFIGVQLVSPITDWAVPNPVEGRAVTRDGGLMASYDRGASWRSVIAPEAGLVMHDMHAMEDGTVYAAGGGGTILRYALPTVSLSRSRPERPARALSPELTWMHAGRAFDARGRKLDFGAAPATPPAATMAPKRRAIQAP